MLHHWIKKDPQCILLEPQCLRYQIDELVAQFLALSEVPQECLFKAGDILLIMPLARDQVRTRLHAASGHSLEQVPIA